MAIRRPIFYQCGDQTVTGSRPMSDQSLYLLTEAAERTGLTVEAIRQRIKRGRLEAVKGNDGLLRVRLTTADLESIVNRSPIGQMPPTATGQVVEDDRLTKALQAEAAALRERAARAEGESATLREQVESERARADRAEAAATAARVLADQRLQEVAELREWAGRAAGESAALREQITAERAALGEQVTAERKRADQAEAEREKAHMGRAAAEAGLEGLREALAEARRPWWRKVLGR